MIRWTLILFGALVLFMISGGIPVEGADVSLVFRTPLFACLLVGLCGLLVACCIRIRRGLGGLFFLFAHLGVVLILAGAGLGRLYRAEGQVALPFGVMGFRQAIDALPAATPEDESVPLGFSLAVTDFEVDYYDPSYNLFKPEVAEPERGDDYALSGEFEMKSEGGLELPAYGVVPRSLLWDEIAEVWRQQVALTNGWVLQCGSRTPKVFDAMLEIETDGGKELRPLRVNAPVTVSGWRIYLMDYKMNPRPYVVCLLRRDPGRKAVIAGIWLVIVGIAGLCWFGAGKRRQRGVA